MPQLGFRLARTLGMEGSTGNLHEFPVAPGNTTPIFKGDLITLNGGYVEKSAGDAGADILGIFWGCKFVDTDGSFEFKNYWDGVAGRTSIQAAVSIAHPGTTLLVAVDPAQVYTAADVGVRKAAAAGAGGSTATGYSSQILGAAGATVATAPLVVQRFLNAVGDTIIPAAAGDATWAEVMIANNSATASFGP